MAAQYTTEQQAMALGATKVDDAATQIQGHIASLRGEVEQMLSGWRGNAAGSMAQVHNNFETQANKINQALRTMHDNLLKTHQTYGTQEETQTQTLSGLAGQINA